MKRITKALIEVNHLEQLVSINSCIHQLHPLLKMIMALMLLVGILTANNILALLIYCLVILIIIKLAKLPVKKILTKTLVGLPFSFCIGLSNLLLMQNQVSFYGITLTSGFISFLMIILKTTLTLSVIFSLIATTGFDVIAGELIHLKVPAIFVLQLLMTYRYIFLLVEEASSMSQAYLLRNPNQKGIAMKDMGSFLGSLLIRSFHRCQEIYKCMETRGFNVNRVYVNYRPLQLENYFILMIAAGLFLIVKMVGL